MRLIYSLLICITLIASTDYPKAQERQSELIPIINIENDTVGYIHFENGIADRLYYSPKHHAFYSKEVSGEIYESFSEQNKKQSPKRDITSFYGDVVLNPFKQPNYLNTDYSDPHEENFYYYGSGDVNNDGKVDFEDHEEMESGTSNDRADIDLDGNKNTTADRTLLYNYLTDQIPYLPAHWDFSTTTEKENHRSNFFSIDSTNFINFGDCDHFVTQTQINSSGVEAISNSGLNFGIYDTTQNARFNIPMYRVSTETGSGNLHGINAIFTGSITTNFYDWTFVEPQTDEVVSIGNYSLNEFADIERYCYFYSNLVNQYLYGAYPVIDFDLTGGTPSVSSQSEGLIEDKPVEFTYIHPGGEKPNDTLMLYREYMENSNPIPDSSGNVVNYEDWASVIFSDSTNRTGTSSDSTFFNYDIFRAFKVVSDYSDRIDTTLCSRDSVNFPDRPAQLIQIRDWANPTITRNHEDTVMYTSEFDASGIIRSDVNDNCGYWDSTYVQTSTRNSNPDSCNYYNFTITDSTYAKDPSNNDTSDVFTVQVEIDPTYFTYVPSNQQIQYTNNLDLSPGNTGGMAEADNDSGAGVSVTYEDVSNQNPDSTDCDHYNFTLDRNWFATDTVCYTETAEDNTLLTVYKPNSLVCDSFPTSPVYIARGESKDPSNTGEPSYKDTLVEWFPTAYEYYDEVVEATPTDTTWHRHFTGYEEICNTTTEDSIQTIVRDLTIGNRENSLESTYRIYPNPSNGFVNVELYYKQLSTIKILIYSSSGQLMNMRKENLSGHAQIKIWLPENIGVYILKAYINGEPAMHERILKINR